MDLPMMTPPSPDVAWQQATEARDAIALSIAGELAAGRLNAGPVRLYWQTTYRAALAEVERTRTEMWTR